MSINVGDEVSLAHALGAPIYGTVLRIENGKYIVKWSHLIAEYKYTEEYLKVIKSSSPYVQMPTKKRKV